MKEGEGKGTPLNSGRRSQGPERGKGEEVPGMLLEGGENQPPGDKEEGGEED